VLDPLLNWILDLVDAALGTLPSWSPSLPGFAGLLNPLAQINWLVALDVPWTISLALLALGPALLLTSLTLWVVGLFTPTATTR
jgi:hypothetical protein